MAAAIPTCAQDAQAQGWHMICVVPTSPLNPTNLLDLIYPHFEENAQLKFTYKNRVLDCNQFAVWVKGFKWSCEGRDVLLKAFFDENVELKRFVREIMKIFMPGLILSYDAPTKSHAARSVELRRQLKRIPKEGLRMTVERTLVLIKPDAVAAGHADDILAIIRGANLVISKRKPVDNAEDFAAAHYAEHEGKPFYPGTIAFMSEGPLLALLVTGENAIATMRKLNGATRPAEAEEGTIRALFGQKEPRELPGGIKIFLNAVHASETIEAAERELRIWFPELFRPGDLRPMMGTGHA